MIMKQYRHSKSSLFLLELMLNLLFFAVLVTICLQLFLKAHNLSKDTTLLHRAVTACNSIAEVYQSNLGVEDMLLTIFPEALNLNDTILIYFDSNFTACSEFESTYRAILSKNEGSDTVNIRFLRREGTTIIYELTFSSYAPRSLESLMGGDNP